MSNFIQGMVQQLVADQRANAEESRNQAISIANLAGQEQRMKMLESEYQAKEEERNRKNAFNTDLSNLASNLLYEQKEVADANGNLRMQTVPKQFASLGDQISAIAQLQAGKLALAVKHKMVDEKTLQDSYTFSRQLEKDGTNNLIENFFANPNDPKNVAAIATKFGLDPNTTKIVLGRDTDGMPTVMAQFVGPDGKPQQRDLSPVLNAMGADAYIRMLEGAKTRSAIRENESTIRKNESTIEYNRAKAKSEGQPKPLSNKDKADIVNDFSRTISTLSANDNKLWFTNDKIGFIAKQNEKEATQKMIDSTSQIASSIVDYQIKNTNNYIINAQSAYSISKIIAKAKYFRGMKDPKTGRASLDNPLVELGNQGLLASGGIDEKSGRPIVVTTDGTRVPMPYSVKEFKELIDEYKLLKAQEAKDTKDTTANSQAIPYDPNTMFQ